MNGQTGTIFQQGAIQPAKIADCIARYGADTQLGAYSCFIGQVRADIIDGKTVNAIEYTAYEEMALKQIHSIAGEITTEHQLNGVEILHSIGVVYAGEICLFVLTAARHRSTAIMACGDFVERIKTELPIWGRELLEGEAFQWKINH